MVNNFFGEHTQLIVREFDKYFSEKPDAVKILSGGASGKLIHRIFIKDSTYIGIYNDDIPENLAFIGFTKSFASTGLNVPQVYHFSEDKKIYFLNDLGDVTLHKFLLDTKNEKERMKFNRKALDNLLKFQVKGRDIIDFSLCYQSPTFDLAQIHIDEQKFIRYYLPHNKKKTDSEIISAALDLINGKVLSEDKMYFMYRDFQPRNIIVNEGNLFFIDYQTGRKGPL
jgi:aminoglycoside/choline kinase family phosphotransferase